jgi:hypothetical protein
MTNLKNLLLALAFLVVGGTIHAAEEAHHEGSGAAEEAHKPDFFPKKQADKSKATRLPMAELIEPKALAVVTGTSVTLKWKAVEGAESYRVQVATDPNFKWLVTQQDFHKETSLQVNDLKAGEHYFWRVYAVNTQEDPGWTSSFSSMSSFAVK